MSGDENGSIESESASGAGQGAESDTDVIGGDASLDDNWSVVVLSCTSWSSFFTALECRLKVWVIYRQSLVKTTPKNFK